MKSHELPGSCRAEIFADSPGRILSICAERGILIFAAEYKGPCCVEFIIREKNEPELIEICRRSGAELNIISRRGGSKTRAKIKSRLRLIIAAALVSFALLFSSFFIWDIDIVSDGAVDEEKILNILSKYGLDTGTFRLSLDVDILRAQLLSECRELSWMTVNVSGSRAQVVVKKEEELPELYDMSRPADIIAARPGKILSVETFNGVPAVSAGDEVEKGQLLIGSCAESLSKPPRFLRARGRIKAQTEREITAVCPRRVMKKTAVLRRRSRWALKLGKKRVNFYFNSGKCIDGCVKIIKEYNLGVEGLFALPLGLVREEFLFFDLEEGDCLREKDMERELMRRLSSDTEGEILRSELDDESSAELIRLCLRASCIEEIGQLTERHNP